MKENDKDIEKLIGKVMKQQDLQAPSFDFTSKVMARVAVAQTTQAARYQPLIARTGWLAIFGSLLVICLYLFLEAKQQADQYAVDLSLLYDNKLSEIVAAVPFSEVTMYALIVLAFLILIQIPLLKNHFGRKHLAQ